VAGFWWWRKKNSIITNYSHKKKVDFGVNDFHSEEFSLGVVAFHLV
jgi:hypothetical protein